VSPEPSLSTPAATEPQNYPVFMDAGLLSPFNLKRGLFFLLVPLPALGICLHFGHALLGFALMALGVWPFRFRCRVEPEGVTVSWLFIKEHMSWDEIVAVEVGADQRRGVIGKRAQALFLERRDKPRVTLRASADVLSRLAARIAERA
jgi:hypothetical protein